MGGLPLRTPTYRSLGKPLPYQLTNRTHAHLLPPELSSLNNAIQRSYGVLFNISIDYPPVEGRLHTRYAPVRRSSADCKHSLLPLDLHVLSLPLAFILSQDQTLRCIKVFNSSSISQKNFETKNILLFRLLLIMLPIFSKNSHQTLA